MRPACGSRLRPRAKTMTAPNAESVSYGSPLRPTPRPPRPRGRRPLTRTASRERPRRSLCLRAPLVLLVIGAALLGSPRVAHAQTAPTIDSVSVVSDPGADDTYGLGDTITVAVEFTAAVTVTGTPQITLRVGGGAAVNLKLANYASGSGTTTLRFSYVVQAMDMDDNGIYLEANELVLNGGTIQNAAGVDAVLTYPTEGQQSGHKVDGSTADTTPPALASATVEADGAEITLLFDEPYEQNAAFGLTTTDFSVTADGSSVTVGQLGFIFTSGMYEMLELKSLSPVITYGQTVTVSYTDPPGDNSFATDPDIGVIEDLAGNDAASFTTGSGGVPAVVNNVPNTPPTFQLESTTREVAENSAAGTDVGDPVTATDADGHTLTYTLEGTDAASFQIVSASGQIQTTSGVTYDYETKSSYSVTVKADDANGGTDTIDVTINLLDVDDTNTPPEFGATIAAREVAENSAAGTDVGAPVTATDFDDDTLTYTLEGTDAASFQIVSATGQIQTTSGVTYDFETKSRYSVTVKADDNNGGTDTIDVTINLTDVDEAADGQDIDAKDSVEVLEGHQAGLEVRLSAAPSSGVTVTVMSNDAEKVTVMPASLTFTTTNWDDYQELDIIPADDPDADDETVTLTLSAPGFTTKTVTVTVTDDDGGGDDGGGDDGDPDPVPALPLLGHLLLALGLTGAGVRVLSRRPRVPPAA